ncbi:unnamed protein product, partial [Allacma fusca]
DGDWEGVSLRSAPKDEANSSVQNCHEDQGKDKKEDGIDQVKGSGAV